MFTANCSLVRNNVTAEWMRLTINQDRPAICLLCICLTRILCISPSGVLSFAINKNGFSALSEMMSKYQGPRQFCCLLTVTRQSRPKFIRHFIVSRRSRPQSRSVYGGLMSRALSGCPVEPMPFHPSSAGAHLAPGPHVSRAGTRGEAARMRGGQQLASQAPFSEAKTSFSVLLSEALFL